MQGPQTRNLSTIMQGPQTRNLSTIMQGPQTRSLSNILIIQYLAIRLFYPVVQ